MAKLTRKGEAKLRETAALWQIAQERFENRFGVTQAKALRQALAVIAAEEFDAVSEPPPAPRSPKRRVSRKTA